MRKTGPSTTLPENSPHRSPYKRLNLARSTNYLIKPLRHGARQYVGGSAGRIGNDDAYGLEASRQFSTSSRRGARTYRMIRNHFQHPLAPCREQLRAYHRDVAPALQ